MPRTTYNSLLTPLVIDAPEGLEIGALALGARVEYAVTVLRKIFKEKIGTEDTQAETEFLEILDEITDLDTYDDREENPEARLKLDALCVRMELFFKKHEIERIEWILPFKEGIEREQREDLDSYAEEIAKEKKKRGIPEHESLFGDHIRELAKEAGITEEPKKELADIIPFDPERRNPK